MAAIVLAVFVAVLPVRLNRSSNQPLAEGCLRLADHPRQPNADDIPELERCSIVVPMDVELLADLGAAYEHGGRQLDAEKTYLAALALDPDYADVRSRLAALLLQRGAAAQARVHAEHALRIQPNRASVQELLDTIARSGGQ